MSLSSSSPSSSSNLLLRSHHPHATTGSRMSLNCLTCGSYSAKPRRTDMEVVDENDDGGYDGRPSTATAAQSFWDRSRSGEIAPQRYARLRGNSIQHPNCSGDHLQDKKKGHRKTASTGGHILGGMDVRDATAEPRLVRSGGMRRDWSFEDLPNQKANTAAAAAAAKS